MARRQAASPPCPIHEHILALGGNTIQLSSLQWESTMSDKWSEKMSEALVEVMLEALTGELTYGAPEKLGDVLADKATETTDGILEHVVALTKGQRDDLSKRTMEKMGAGPTEEEAEDFKEAVDGLLELLVETATDKLTAKLPTFKLEIEEGTDEHHQKGLS